MGAIVLYEGSIDEAGRIAGMVKLGEKLIDTYKDDTSTKPKKKRDAKAICDTLRAFIGAAGFSLRYEYIGNPGSLVIISAVVQAGKIVRCGLALPTSPTVEYATLNLNFGKDQKNASGKNFDMTIAFANDVDHNAFLYLGIAADDIQSLPLGDAGNYLAAFKFLTRCK